MALSDIYAEVREVIYGQGFGERPPIVLGAANANESVSAPKVTFTLDSNEGDKVAAGNVLAHYSPSDADTAFVVYVTSVSTDTVTGINGGLVEAPAISGSDSGDLDDAVLEIDPLVTGHGIHNAIKTVVARHLWPELYNVETKTITSPDLVDGQEAVAADVQEILSAHQRIGSTNYPIAVQRHPTNVNTTLASTGRMASFDWINGSTGYYTAKTKIVVTDDDGSPELTRLISTGAAALALGGTFVEATIENTKKDNAQAVSQRAQAASLLWRDFLTLKQEYARELGIDNESFIVIDRG